MNKINRLNKEIESLEQQKEQARKFIEEADRKVNLKYDEIAKAYQAFYEKKRNKEFVLYENFPSLEAFKIYLSKISYQFPLYDDGTLNIKELASMIKHLYQLKTGEDYSIVTIGTVERDGKPVYGDQVFSSNPHLHFMIGNEKTLKPYQEYNGTFVNSNKLYGSIYLYARGQNMISMEADRDYSNSMNIECLTGNMHDQPGLLNYYDEYCDRYKVFRTSLKKQIFSPYIRSSLNYSGGYKMKGIKDVFDFRIHPFDSYIAKVLISTIIYKRNNGIEELSNDDYQHIFDVLFGEKVDIVGDSEKEIPKQLIYVPNKKSGR